MTRNEDPKVELENLRAILAARVAEETEQAKRFAQFARERSQRVAILTAKIVEIDAAIEAIDSRREARV